MKDIHASTRPMADVMASIAADYSTHRDTIDAFHRLWYASRQTHGMTYFENIPILKNPMDLWVYQDIIWDLQPTLIIETGTAYGGSALYFARQLDKLGRGAVISIDIAPHEALPTHDRITYVRGSSTDLIIAEAVEACAKTHPRVMVILDADHSQEHVLTELGLYAPLVSVNQFLVVEDTNINGRPVPIDWKGGPGPGPAVDAWLPAHPEFMSDLLAERYLLTHHPHGWLRRVY